MSHEWWKLLNVSQFWLNGRNMFINQHKLHLIYPRLANRWRFNKKYSAAINLVLPLWPCAHQAWPFGRLQEWWFPADRWFLWWNLTRRDGSCNTKEPDEHSSRSSNWRTINMCFYVSSTCKACIQMYICKCTLTFDSLLQICVLYCDHVRVGVLSVYKHTQPHSCQNNIIYMYIHFAILHQSAYLDMYIYYIEQIA